MPKPLHLLPTPHAIKSLPGTFTLPPELFILLEDHPATRDLFPAEQFLLQAQPLTNTQWHIARTPRNHAAAHAREIRVTFDDTIFPKLSPELREQSYRLAITPKAITLWAPAAPGIFYAFQTLLQIIRQAASKKKSPITLPCLAITDHPNFPRRGLYLDTARGKVPTLATLLQVVDDIAHLKYNEFQLYVENNFQFRKNPAMYDDTTPLTAEELLILDAACRERHIDFVPSLTSLGHFEKILTRPQYRRLAEAQPQQLKAIGAPVWVDAPWSLCVTDPNAKKLLRDMYDEFLPNFSSAQFNICCDEAYDLGRVRSKKLAAKIGTGQMYIDWIDYCNGMSRSHGKSIQMWGDIILNHPELIAKLPEDATLLEWGYEHDHKFDEHCALFAQRLKASVAKSRDKQLPPSRSFYVSPGTSSWLTLSARTKNACGNIHNAATAGLKHGARGLLVTDWGDMGHQQLFSMSLTPIAYGAAASWNLAATADPYKDGKRQSKIETLLTAASMHLFHDSTGTFAAIAYDLGLTYERLGWQRFNASLDWWLFREKWDFANYVNRAPALALAQTIAATKKIAARFKAAAIDHPDAPTIRDEFLFTCDEIIHTCRRTQLRQAWLAAASKTRNPEEPSLRDKPPKPLPKTFKKQMAALAKEVPQLKARFATLWLTRNKPSRLDDVLKEFDRLAKEYRDFA